VRVHGWLCVTAALLCWLSTPRLAADEKRDQSSHGERVCANVTGTNRDGTCHATGRICLETETGRITRSQMTYEGDGCEASGVSGGRLHATSDVYICMSPSDPSCSAGTPQTPNGPGFVFTFTADPGGGGVDPLGPIEAVLNGIADLVDWLFGGDEGGGSVTPPTHPELVPKPSPPPWVVTGPTGPPSGIPGPTGAPPSSQPGPTTPSGDVSPESPESPPAGGIPPRGPVLSSGGTATPGSAASGPILNAPSRPTASALVSPPCRSIAFTGCQVWFMEDQDIVKTCAATSGQRPYGAADQGLRDLGPIPEGIYTLFPWDFTRRGGPSVKSWFRTPGWGWYRGRLYPNRGTDTQNRSGFFFHGDLLARPGTLGCIDIGHCDWWANSWLQTKPNTPVTVYVRYIGGVCN
jgi:hypothetical protein